MTDLATLPAISLPPLAGPPPTSFADTVAEQLMLVVAPAPGRFEPQASDDGQVLQSGTVVAHITGGQGRRVAVVCPAAGVLQGFLVRPGQRVRPGQALAWYTRVQGA